MKKSLLIVLVVLLLVISGCKNKDNEGIKLENEVSIVVPNGTPFLAVGGLCDYENINIINTTNQADLISGLVKGEMDIVIAPITLGLKTYANGTNKYKLDSVITSNNTYLVSKSTTKLDSIKDVTGKKITAFGNGNTPGIMLEEALKKDGIKDDVEVEYSNSVADVMTGFNAGTPGIGDYVLLAEPQITQLKVKFDMELNVLDLSTILDSSTIFAQAAVFVNPNSNHIDDVNKTLELIKNNINSLNNDPSGYASMILNKDDYFNSLTKDVIETSIPKCNITYINAKNNISKLNDFYSLLNSYSPAILNGSTVNEEFYY